MGRPKDGTTVADRFWPNVDKGDGSGCWLWTGSTVGRGYGGIRVDGRSDRAHRVSWVLHHGPIPDGLWVRHVCDNPPCVRPDHLLLGTRQDNMNDMVERGRSWKPWGERNPRSRLTDEQVADIRRRHQFRVVTYDMLAKEYGVSRHSISEICRGKTRSGYSRRRDVHAFVTA